MIYLLHHLLSESAAACPDKEALIFQDSRMTYGELERESNRLAHCLLDSGVKGGARVGIYMNRGIDSLVGLFGVLKAGAAYVPIDPLCPPGRLDYILNKCAIKYLLVSREKLVGGGRLTAANSPVEKIMAMNGLDPGFRQQGSAALFDWRKMRESAGEDAPASNAVDSDLAYILFTSGSTGNPKGVMLSHLNALTFVNSARDFFGITGEDRFSNVCPLHFDMSVFDLFVAFKAGAAVVIIAETAAVFPVKLAEVIARERISVWNSVPSALSLLARYTSLDRYDLSSLRLVLFAGEPFPLKYLRRLREAVPGARFCNLYGQTEANTSTYYWVERIPADGNGSLPIGRALPNFEVFALDEEGRRITGPDREGELYVRASTVAQGYWGEAEKTEKAFVKDPLRPDRNERVYKTGDLVRLAPDGNYLFLGRKDHMIKSRGYRIEIGEIESVLCDHPEITNAVVIPIPDELVGNRISAIVVPSAPGRISKEDIVRHCSERLPKYMLPELIEFQDALPTTSSGKIDRQKLGRRNGKDGPVRDLPAAP